MEVPQGCTYEDLNFDEACVALKSNVDSPNLWLYALSSDCASCPYTRTAQLSQSEAPSIRVSTARSQHWRIFDAPLNESFIPASQTDGFYCQLSPRLDQYGIYELTVDRNSTCQLRVNKEPQNAYLPLAIAFGAIVLLLSGLAFLKLIKRCIARRRSSREPGKTADNVQVKRRVRSLDTVRGMSILLMIFVNGGAGGYPALEHATWNGLCLGDLVFPCFLWIMGVCIPLSVSGQLSRGTRRLSLCRGIVKRSLYLFLIGLFLNTLGGKTQLESIRIFGVLQRFAVAYLVAGLVYALTYRPRDLDFESSVLRAVRDMVALIPQWIVGSLVLAAHCVVVFRLPVPGCPKGYLGPGGRHLDGKYLNCTGGATGYVDRVLLGVEHVYQEPTASGVYGSGPFDPEGILGCLTSIFQVFLGIQAGQILREYRGWRGRVLRWLIWAVLLGIVGAALHYTGLVPVNKNLWSISFVLVTTCFNLGLLSVCYILVDVARVWEGGPFRIPGMNALVMYVGHQVFFEMFPFHWRYGAMNTHGWLLAEVLWCLGLWTCIAYLLHRRKIYVTL